MRPALEVIGAEAGRRHVGGIYMLVLPQQTFFFADCTVNIDPDAEMLAEIASATAEFVGRLGIEPRVALLSFSNFGSVRHAAAEKVRRAVTLLHEREPALQVDGEMQADTAVVERVLTKTYPFSKLRGPANVLIFPNLDAANISYKLLDRVGGAQAIGPILVGMAQPVHVLQRGSEVNDIVNMAVIGPVGAQEHGRRPGEPGGSARALERRGAVRARPVRGGGREPPPRAAVRHAECVARAVRLQHVPPPRPVRARRLLALLARAPRPRVPGRPGAARHALGDVHRHPLWVPDDPDRRHPLRGRAQEGGLLDPQLPAAVARPAVL